MVESIVRIANLSLAPIARSAFQPKAPRTSPKAGADLFANSLDCDHTRLN